MKPSSIAPRALIRNFSYRKRAVLFTTAALACPVSALLVSRFLRPSYQCAATPPWLTEARSIASSWASGACSLPHTLSWSLNVALLIGSVVLMTVLSSRAWRASRNHDVSRMRALLAENRFSQAISAQDPEEWSDAGFTPEEALAFLTQGLTLDQAGAIRAARLRFRQHVSVLAPVGEVLERGSR